jgi:hypothetical protein
LLAESELRGSTAGPARAVATKLVDVEFLGGPLACWRLHCLGRDRLLLTRPLAKGELQMPVQHKHRYASVKHVRSIATGYILRLGLPNCWGGILGMCFGWLCRSFVGEARGVHGHGCAVFRTV